MNIQPARTRPQCSADIDSAELSAAASANLWMRVAIGVVIALAASQATTEVHRFGPEWRPAVERSLSSREVMALGKPMPVPGESGKFTVRIASKALVPRFVRFVAVTVPRANGEQNEAAARGDLAALFVVRPSDGTAEASVSVSLERVAAGEYRVASQDQDRLVGWLLDNVDALDAGQVAVDALDGLAAGHEADVTVSLVPPGASAGSE